MRLVATLISDPAHPRLTPSVAETAHRALSGLSRDVSAPDWLATGVACDLYLDDADPAAVDQILSRAIGTYPIDRVVQAAAGRRKRLLTADMESTVIVNEMVDELAQYLGVEARVADITRRAMNGEIGFRPALIERVSLLGGLEEEILLTACERIEMTPGAATMVATARAHGTHTVLISGGFEVFSRWVAERLGFDEHFANALVVQDGVVTGHVREPLIGRQGKCAKLLETAETLGIGAAEALAAGDGANDLDMIAAAGMGVAYHAKKAVAEAAPVRVDHGDLTALLYIQGYRRDEFVTP